MITITMSFSIYSFNSPDRLAYDLASALALGSTISRKVLTASANTVGSPVTSALARSCRFQRTMSTRSMEVCRTGLILIPAIVGAAREWHDEVEAMVYDQRLKWLAAFDNYEPYPSGP
jgi:hypothetical protein